jgi:lipopolysaccharide biosynthesis glycosyltransferase
MPLATALRSIAEAKLTIDPLEVYILYSTFEARIQTLVSNSVPPGSLMIHWVPVELKRFEACATASHISRMTYARLLIPDLLPKRVSRILYLDADILVFDDLSALQDIDLNGFAIGAVLDRLDSLLKAGKTLWTKELPRVRNYFNAGVILVDLERWRNERISEKAIDYLSRHPRSPLSDQDALNVVCDDGWQQLEPRWNFLNDHETAISRIAARKRPGILHFAGRLKPWQIGILDPNACLYDLIRSRTCFARTDRDKFRDFFAAPLRFLQSGLLWQLRRVLRRNKMLRRIWFSVIHPERMKATRNS